MHPDFIKTTMVQKLIGRYCQLLTAIIVISKVAMPGAAPHGFTTLASLLAFFSGAQLFAIGMIGEYVHKIYVQSLRMPLGFVRDMINFD